MIRGAASYAEALELRPGTVLEVELLDVSKADAPAERRGSVSVPVRRLGPIPFVLSYDPAAIEAANRYSVAARLVQDGQVILRDGQRQPRPDRRRRQYRRPRRWCRSPSRRRPRRIAGPGGAGRQLDARGHRRRADRRGRGILCQPDRGGRSAGPGRLQQLPRAARTLDGEALTSARSPPPAAPARRRRCSRRRASSPPSRRRAASRIEDGRLSSRRRRQRGGAARGAE